ncbi:MAG: hypothetical protein RL215_1438 [Planctomycetota bacterium]
MNAASYGWESGTREQQVDPVPEVDGVGFIDEVGASGWLSGGAQGGFSGDVSGCGILDIGDGDEVFPVTNLPKSASSGGEQESGDEVIIAGSPDQMGPQSAGDEPVLSGGTEYGLFCERFGVGIVAEPTACIGQGFVSIQMIAPIEHNAG